MDKLIDTVIECFAPCTSVELLVLGINIIKLSTNLVQSLVGNMNTIRGLNNALVKNSTDILPLFDEPLSLWGGHEFSVELFELKCLLGLSPSLESSFEVQGSWSILDLLSNNLDVVSFFLDLSLTGLGNLDFKSVDGSLGFFKLDVSGRDDTEEKCDGDVLHVCKVVCF